MPGTPDTTPHRAHLRLLWPEWQGAGAAMVGHLAPEFPLDAARRAHTVGTTVLQAVLPPSDGPVATVPVSLGDPGGELGAGERDPTGRDGGRDGGREQRGHLRAAVTPAPRSTGSPATLQGAADVVHVQQVLRGFPLIDG
ncbi:MULTISPECIES: hypothetical protein [unclassified Streptomyces]|uniref:hypothetical protein n=1 Tax=unclassified Streptomyces TaxID=2593676 RepID=UPI00336A436F